MRRYFLVGIFVFASLWARAVVSQTWVVETVDTVGTTGHYTSIALDSRGHPHITYTGGTGITLRYAHWMGTEWEIQHFDTIHGPSMGWHPSIALDHDDQPWISGSNAGGVLECGHWTGSEWLIDTADNSLCTEATDIAIDSSGYPHISYIYGNDIKYARWTGSDWFTQVVDSTKTIRKASMDRTSIVLDSNDRPHIAYCRRTGHKAVKYACWTGTDWSVHVVDTAYTESPCLALDNNDHPHVAYGDRCLRYAHWTDSCFSIETIDLAPSLYECIAVDSSNYPHISYCGYGPLKYARLTPSGWSIEEVDTIGYTGLYTSIALDSDGLPHISYQHYNSHSLKYARLRLSVEEDQEAGHQKRRTKLTASPNPFTHNTVVEFVVRGSEFVDEKLTSIEIHDAAGRLVKTLVNEEKEPGRHEVTWNAKGMPAGIYFARLQAGDYREVQKLILMR